MSFDLDAYTNSIRKISNRELIRQAEQAIQADTVMAGSRSYDGEHGLKATALYAEAARRGNTDLYQRAFNEVAADTGHSSMGQLTSIPVEFGDPTISPSPAGG